jgi:hypothetical protein
MRPMMSLRDGSYTRVAQRMRYKSAKRPNREVEAEMRLLTGIVLALMFTSHFALAIQHRCRQVQRLLYSTRSCTHAG